MMIAEYQKPSRCWKREISVSISLWPRWLAQWLCNHADSKAWGFGHDNETGVPTTIHRCSDCYKLHMEPIACKHPSKKWEVSNWENIAVGGGGTHKVPSKWYCTDCGYAFKKDMQCPECHLDMEITEWMGMFSGRFRCLNCGTYYFREDLDGCKE